MALLTFNVYDRVFFVRGERYGTAFALDIDGRQYLVSAAHVIGNSSVAGALQVFLNKRWVALPTTVVGTGSGEIDVIVLASPHRLAADVPLEPSLELALGQDVYFAGFPLKMWSNGGELMYGRPLPFVKKGTLSAGWDPEDKVKRLYVDAINNEGFSGGPLVFHHHRTGRLLVGAVVSKFKTEEEAVLTAQGEPSGLTVQYNTGFLIAYGVNHVIELVRRNPIGFPLAVPTG